MSRKCGDFLVEADAVARLFDDETRFAEGVYVAVDGAARHLEPFGQLVDVVGGVAVSSFISRSRRSSLG